LSEYSALLFKGHHLPPLSNRRKKGAGIEIRSSTGGIGLASHSELLGLHHCSLWRERRPKTGLLCSQSHLSAEVRQNEARLSAVGMAVRSNPEPRGLMSRRELTGFADRVCFAPERSNLFVERVVPIHLRVPACDPHPARRSLVRSTSVFCDLGQSSCPA
jgi:hypothetical protein